jgi:steroid delta-isomerase-like uncharacterized protein
VDLEERKEIVRRSVALWCDEARADDLRALLASDYVHHSANGDLDAEQLIEQLAYLAAAFTDVEYEIVHVLGEDEIVAAFVQVQMTHTGTFAGIPATGRRVSTSGATFFRLCDGVIVEDWDAWGLLSLVRQLSAPGA